MKILLAVLGVIVLIGPASAAAPPYGEAKTHDREMCDLVWITHGWSFDSSYGDFLREPCDAEGVSVWEYGVPSGIGYDLACWGTNRLGDYPDDAGEGLYSVEFFVGFSSFLMEIWHYYDFETGFDGGNVVLVDDPDNPLVPMGGYDGIIYDSDVDDAHCVDGEMGFTGSSGGWVYDCFDLSAYDGQIIQLRFDVGSDESVTYPGWYIGSVCIGTDYGCPAELTTWGRLKSLY